MQTIGEGFGSCVNPGELIQHFWNRFKRRAGYPVELQNYSLIAALRARVSPVVKIVIVHPQPVAMYDQQHMTKTRCRGIPFGSDQLTVQHIHFFKNSVPTSAAISS